MRFHLEQQVDVLHARWALAGRCRSASQARTGRRSSRIREEHRDARGIGVLSHLGRDLRHGLRQFRRSPGFSALAVLCLGLAIGVNTSIFGVLNSVLLRPMPVQQPERLIVVSRGDTASFSYPTYREFRDRNRTLSGLAASMPSESDLDIDGSSTFVAAEAVSGNYSTVIGVRTALGRWFSSDAEPAAVISYTVWQRQFNLDPNVLGRTIRSESQSYSIAGVAPREFNGIFSPLRTDIWVPIGTRPSLVALQEDRTARTLMLFGRLADNATPVQASSELNTIEAQLATERTSPSEAVAPIVADQVRGIANVGNRRRAQVVATFLTVVVALVLLIACVNVGNLLLVRGAVRQREFALRRALGASRHRVLQQLLTESLLLAIGGGICGLVLARWTNAVIERSLPLVQGLFPHTARVRSRLASAHVHRPRFVGDHGALRPAASLACVSHGRPRRLQGRDRRRCTSPTSARTRRAGRDVVRPAARRRNVRPGARADADRRSRLCRERPALRVLVYPDARYHPCHQSSDLLTRHRRTEGLCRASATRRSPTRCRSCRPVLSAPLAQVDRAHQSPQAASIPATSGR